MKLLIVAGNYRESNEYVRRVPMYRVGDWAYVDSIDKLMGIENQVIGFYGTWRRREDAARIEQIARTRRCILADLWEI